MTGQITFRRARIDDDQRVLELFKASFSREFALEWWKWFSYACPTGLNRTAVVEDIPAGRLAGSYSLLPIRLAVNGREYKASLCTMVNTHPEYAGRGLFTQIGRFALDHEKDFDTPISLGMPNSKALPGHMKVGWDVMCPLPFLVKHNCQARPHRCREIQTFDQRFDTFYSKIAERFSFIVLKDHRFMNWRVVLRPDKLYTRFVYEENGELHGYIVLKHFDDHGYRKSHILDIQADSSRALDELIAAAESFAAGRDELNLWTNPCNPYQLSFEQNGFSQHESSDLLIIHFNFGEKQPIEKEGWWFCLADNDVY